MGTIDVEVGRGDEKAVRETSAGVDIGSGVGRTGIDALASFIVCEEIEFRSTSCHTGAAGSIGIVGGISRADLHTGPGRVIHKPSTGTVHHTFLLS